jgi:hypothetical protein
MLQHAAQALAMRRAMLAEAQVTSIKTGRLGSHGAGSPTALAVASDSRAVVFVRLRRCS